MIERDRAALQIEPCLAAIQSLPEHRRILLPPSLQALKETASQGPIVIVNVTDTSSAALIIRPSPCPVKYIPLPTLDGYEVERFRSFALSGLRSRSRYIGVEEPEATKNDFLNFLDSLWTECVLPILEDLQYYPPRSGSGGGDLPRIWWIGTGLASSLPFHAAGHHTTGSVENTYSCAISSYTSSLKSLRYVRDKDDKMPVQLTTLLVAMPTTPGADDLPRVATESSFIEDIMSSVNTLKHPDSATVLGALNEFSIVHFACHGCSDAINPSRSYLAALQRQDGDSLVPDNLTMQTIIDARSSKVWLAYLSACSTAENRESDFTDEALHLASGFQTTGFKNTIAAMWASDDEICAKVARVFYASLLSMKSEINDENRAVAVALHQTVNQVRLEYLDQPYLWAQYIHFGA